MPEALGHYRILDRIGAGAIGEVYRARDTRLGRTVAIRLPVAEIAANIDRREQFLTDARALATLSHPNIPALYEISDDQGQLFLAFEFVPGETLAVVITGRALNPRRAVDLAVQMADALADAHAAGVVHRDIKPDNIIVTPKGHAKILDFGLAAWTGGDAHRRAAAARTPVEIGAALTTVPYMSPEQALGEQGDERTDIFSLGVVLFEMLTGRLPFNGNTPAAIALQIVQAAAPVPSSLNPALPRELDVVVAKALAKSLDQRYRAAATFAAELRSVAGALDMRSTASEPMARLPRHTRTRHYGRWIVVAVLLVALVAVVWWWWELRLET